MKKVYGFATFKAAEEYAIKNYYRGAFRIVETNSGNFAIEMLQALE